VIMPDGHRPAPQQVTAMDDQFGTHTQSHHSRLVEGQGQTSV
jgi:hypothetical protein